MKNHILFIGLLSASSIVAQQKTIDNPDYEYAKYYIFDRITFTDTATIAEITVTNYPNSWVIINSNSYLKDRNSDKVFRLKRADNYELDKRVFTPESGAHKTTLYFEPITGDIECVDFMRPQIRVEDATWGISLKQSAAEQLPLEISGMWTSNNGESLQIFPKGFFNNGIVEQASIKKSGKNEYSVVLNDGTKHTISLREDKKGVKTLRYDNTTYSPTLTATNNNNHTNWTFAPKQYAEKATTPGKAIVKGYLEHYTPHLGYSALIFRFEDQITRDEKNILVDIAPDGSFEAELPIFSPYWSFVSGIDKGIYLAPFDTIFIYQNLATPHTNKDKLLFLGSEDAVAINTLQPIIAKKFNIPNGMDIHDATDKGLQATLDIKQTLLSEADKYATQINEILAQYNLSDYAKTQLASDLPTDIFTNLLDLSSYYNNKMYLIKKDSVGNQYMETNPDFIPLPEDFYDFYSMFYTTVLNNPLFCTTSSSWAPINRFEFTPTMRQPMIWSHENYKNISEKDSILLRNKEASIITGFADSTLSRLNKAGIGLCYMSDYAIARSLKYTILNYFNDKDLDFKLNVLSTYAPIIKSNHVRSQISNYLIKEIVPNSGPKTTLHQELLAGTKEEEAFANLIKPYEGNVLMIDFWNLGCGPCRAGMLKDRDMVERLKDKKIKFLYVTCDVDSPIEHTEKFLNDNNIKGEQIRISKDDWSRISSKLSISGIPHQTLVDKNGEILMNNHKGIEVNEPVLLQLEQQ